MRQARPNTFAFAHKGLRLALSKLAVLAGKTDYANASALQAVKSLADEVLELLHLHAHAEDTYILPALEERVPGGAARILADHQDLESSISVFTAQLEAITVGSPPGQGSAFYASLFHFYANYLIHMAMEEQDINPLIWENFSDEEILGWQGQIMAELSADQILMFYKYMVPALNPMERQILMGGIKANAPAELFTAIMGMLEVNMLDKEFGQLKIMLNS